MPGFAINNHRKLHAALRSDRSEAGRARRRPLLSILENSELDGLWVLAVDWAEGLSARDCEGRLKQGMSEMKCEGGGCGTRLRRLPSLEPRKPARGQQGMTVFLRMFALIAAICLSGAHAMAAEGLTTIKSNFGGPRIR